MRTPAIIVAGTHSGVGKTSISIAIMAALRRRGRRVQSFKVGPDFIDPTLHERATGRAAYTLDGWMLDPAANRAVFARAADGADLVVVEGVMGLFDGRDAVTDAGSTAEMAKLLGAPVLLVVDASAMARSAAATVHGFESFDPTVEIAGVVFNRVAGEGHFAYLRDAVEASCRARVLGWLPPDDAIAIPERHLGLLTGDEALSDAKLDALVRWIEAGVDVDAIAAIARPTDVEPPAVEERLPVRARIGVARDRAFCFYYRQNLDLLERFGAELVEFSPVSDRRLPDDLDGLYLGGGYPEMYAEELAANESMRAEVRDVCRSGRPVYAECGGFMYLTEAIVDTDGREHPMVGVFPTRARVGSRLAAIGYREVETAGGERARGHEFRYSEIDPPLSGDTHRVEATLGGYVHLHFASCPSFAARFVDACERAVLTTERFADGAREAR